MSITIIAVVAILSALLGYVVRTIGSTAGVVDVGRAAGAVLAEIIRAMGGGGPHP